VGGGIRYDTDGPGQLPVFELAQHYDVDVISI
jgi:hypothetical protein